MVNLKRERVGDTGRTLASVGPPRAAAAAAAAAAGQQAVRGVLTNPDLVERILALLPTPLLAFCRPTKGVQRADRWAAGQVSQTFRQASLRLPWEVVWERQTPAGSAGFLALCQPRQLKAASIRCYSGVVAECATLGRLASGVDTLRLCFPSAPALRLWLVRCGKALWAGRQTCKRIPDQAFWSALSSFASNSGGVSLYGKRVVQDGAGLQIVELSLRDYRGDPVGGLPFLQHLSVSYVEGDEEHVHPLEGWAGPELTQLTLRNCTLEMPVADESEQGPVYSPGTAWLGRLQRLVLFHCAVVVPGDKGLNDLLPCLSQLEITCKEDNYHFPTDTGSFDKLLCRGLPASLQELSFEFHAWHFSGFPEVWLVFPSLTSLTSLSVKLLRDGDELFDSDMMYGFLYYLYRLPSLRQAHLCLAVGFYDVDKVEVYLQNLKAWLLDKGGSLAWRRSNDSDLTDNDSVGSVSTDEAPSYQ